MNLLTSDICSKALELGFNKIGFAKVERLEKENDQLQEWFRRGYHGTMEWMKDKNDERINPSILLPSAKSVISVAMNYYSDIDRSNDKDCGKISRYAWGDDYHKIIKERLKLLTDYIKQIEPSLEAKYFVDTGPIVDKVWAERAGIGWRGKHTITITQEYGSWIFLGEIVCNLECEYNSPASDLCGNCTLCIDACPTQAIIEPYILDASRCISYLTIEHNDETQNDLGAKNDRWIFGCDICQDVCPWNKRHSQATNEKGFYPREYNLSPNLKSWMEMSNEEFNLKFKNSPIRRRKLEGLKRNIKTVLPQLQ